MRLARRLSQPSIVDQIELDNAELAEVEVPTEGIELDTGEVVQFQLMVAGGTRPVGWMAALERP